MLNQPMPGMTDTLEFVKNLWGGMNIPGAMPGMGGMPMPGAGLSVDDLDKKIADLKAVESWLNLNLGMLRGSIQALEIQRGTLATLKAMGDSMAQAMSQTGAASDAAMAPFAHFFAQAAQAAAPATTKPADSVASPPPPSAAASATAAPPQGAEAPHAGMPAAVAWWNLLQDQFRQAVASAMPPDSAHPDKAGGAPPDGGGDSPAGGATPDDSAAGKPSAGQSASAQNGNGNPAPGRRGARGKTDKA